MFFHETLSHAAVDRLRLRRHAQPLRARPGRQGVQPVGAGHQAARRRHRGRPPRPARAAQQLDGVLLAEAGLPQQGRAAGYRRGIEDEAWEQLLRVRRHRVSEHFPFPSRARRIDSRLASSTHSARSMLAPSSCRARRAARSPTGRAAASSRARRERLQAPDDRLAGGARLAGLPALRPARRATWTLRSGRRSAGARPGRAGVRDRRWPADGGRGAADGLVRAARLDADHRAPGALARGLPDAGRAADRADRDEPEHRPDRAARVQAALAPRAVGRPGAACAAVWLLDRLESDRYWPDPAHTPPS